MITVTRGRKIVFNPVKYETVEVFASIAMEIPDDGSPAAETDFFDSHLTELLQPEIDAVAAVTTNSQSIVHEYRYTEESK